MTAPSFGRALEQLSRNECLQLLGQARLGRIGLSIQALPVVLPVNFALSEDHVVVRTVPGTKLDAATAGAVVAFEVDGYEPDGSAGWSVMVQGRVQAVTDPVDLEDMRRLALESWSLNGAADHYMSLSIDTVTGRRFRR
jgi:nitroimidazol reductase NimA-like FMN-containing flavoprotein (pyridoxamine 5'-phosphate oxidase superfamily)